MAKLLRRNILLANSDMAYLGGTQAWIRQMSKTLSRDHEVFLFVANGSYPAGARRFDPNREYDVALINHWPAARALNHAHIHKRIITSHGVIPHEEIPAPGADAYVAVSECVQQRIPYRSRVIRNPIDVDHFAPRHSVGDRLRRVAFVSNRQGAALPILEEACRRLGVELRVVGRDSAVPDPQPVYEWADLVVGIARVALEALACGRNVVCFDYQGFHGVAMPEALPALWRTNFGGHSPAGWPTVDELIEALGSYDAHLNLRDAVVGEHRPEKVVAEYLTLADQTKHSRLAALLRQGPPQVTSPRVTQLLSRIRRGS